MYVEFENKCRTIRATLSFPSYDRRSFDTLTPHSTHNSHYVCSEKAVNIVTIIYIEALGIVLLITLLTLVYQLKKLHG